MEFSMDLLEFRIRHMGIDLRGRDRRVSEELLDGSDISTVGKQGSGEAMSKGMGGNFFDDIGSEGIFLDLVRDEEPGKPHVRTRKRFFYDIISLH